MKTQNLFSAVLNISYVCSDLHSEIIITGVSGNQAQGIFTLDSISIPVSLYRHSGNSKNEGLTNIWFAGADINPNEFVGGTGKYSVPDASSGIPESILLAGAYPTDDALITFNGNYQRRE